MLSNKYKQSLKDLNSRIELLKDRISLLKTIKDNKGIIDIKDYTAVKESLTYCKSLKRTIKANTAITSLLKDY